MVIHHVLVMLLSQQCSPLVYVRFDTLLPVYTLDNIMFDDCRATFLGLVCWRSSGLDSSRLAGETGWRAVKDAPDGYKFYPCIRGYQCSELLQSHLEAAPCSVPQTKWTYSVSYYL